MYIKQVIIQGFKSFRERTVVDPFDPGHNVVVGRNGSGKSNFFQAIQFVLSDEFSRLRADELQCYLHEGGGGPRVISAYIEIIFDNSDGRIPMDKKEVYLRRIFGAKKDQYVMNKKQVSRSEVMNLLESAGFSKSNPYYIVKQGKINQMATAPDAQRLKLLREVAGTRVFDDRCRESKASLRETEGKLEKINELLSNYDERLEILAEEKEELKEFQVLDNQRRYLEFIIYDRELKAKKKNLQDLEICRATMKPIQVELTAEYNEAQEAVQAHEKYLKKAKKEVNSLKEERKIISTEQQELIKEQTKLTLTVNDLLEDVAADNNSRARAEKELEKLKTGIANLEEDLERIIPQYEQIKNVEEKCTRELELKEQKRNSLYALSNRTKQFQVKEHRDEWIYKELAQLEKQIIDKNDYQAKISKDLQRDAERQIALETRIKACHFAIKNQTDVIDDRNKQYDELTKAKDRCQALRKEQYRSESVLQLNIVGLKEDLAKIDQNLRSMIGNSTVNGRDSVKRVIETLGKREDTAPEVHSYFGLVVENFECDESVFTAVEVTAGNRLFHHIVETDQFSTKILKEMNHQKLPGEAAFMTLNRLQTRTQEYPRTNDAVPMISKLNYEPKFDKAMRYIFGKTLICRNLEVASILARSCELDCVTMEGDQAFSKGALTGGYFNPSRSRMKMQRSRSELIAQIDTLEEEMRALRDGIMVNEQSIVSNVTEIQRIEMKNSKAKDILEKMNTEIRLVKGELENMARCRTSKEQSLAQCSASIEAMTATKEGFQSELLQDLTSELSLADQQQVDALTEDIERLKNENKEAFAKRMQLEAKKYKFENLLTNNLVRRRDELVQAMQEISVEDRQHKLQSSKAQLEQVENRLTKVNADFKTLSEAVSTAAKRQKSVSLELQRWKLSEKQVSESMDKNAEDLEKLASREHMIQQKISDCAQKIADLAALPSHETFNKFTALSTNQLLAEIEKLNKQLKKYRDVNKRASDQFTSFSDQKESLNNRKAELDRGHEKILELMMVLEQQKFKAIDFTFKQVSKYFAEVFQRLVPLGHAQLVMQTADGEERNAAESESTQESADFDRFVGVGIRVSFARQTGETREMNQLSGGQKSLVALALIFAIQKCDPAPFYLFDEIDQALDAEHRKAVSDMIHELSASAQFITTTFRPELLTRANKFYGVKFRNKVSHVECVTLEEAADFVEDNATHD